jgi:hypothetical protein
LDSDESGLAFYSESQDGGSGGRGSARGQNNGRGFGRGGCGRGAGCTASTERHNNGRRYEETPHDDENTQFLLDNADSVSETVNNYYDYHCVCLQQSRMGISNLRQVVLIDSCSSVNLIADPALLYNIHTVERRMRVRCNAGVRSTNQKGWLGNFPEAVWHDPRGVANILLLYSVHQYYRVQYDSAREDAISVTTPEGKECRFYPILNGLYAYKPSPDDADGWAFVTTVSEKKDVYTKRAYLAAVWAPRVQNIIMHPSKQDNLWIADRHLLPNSPVQTVDIKAAEDIFGCDIGSLKGKTVAQGSDHVPRRTDGVPPAIKERYLNVTLPVDIIFLNKMPF